MSGDLPEDRLRALIAKQGAGTLEERQEYYAKAEQTQTYANLNSILTSFVMQASDFRTADAHRISGQEMAKLYRKYDMDEDGVQAYISKLAAMMFAFHDDHEQLATYFVENDLVLPQAMTLHLAFLSGYLYHHRNTTFLEELLAGALKGNDDESAEA